jgi:NDP-sugar pyrophosphorylase family protein
MDSNRLNILIPLGGRGRRFLEKGYSDPKPYIDIMGKMMVELVVESIGLDANYIYVVQREERSKYNLDELFNRLTPGCKIVEIPGPTEGTASTTLAAEHLIDSDLPFAVINNDQILDWDHQDFIKQFLDSEADGSIVVFEADDPKWSFVRTDNNGNVTEVAEKKVISNLATVGVYLWKHGKDYVRYAKQMIDKGIRTNNEFYVSPIYNEAIADGRKIITYKVDNLYGVGTPEDLDAFIRRVGASTMTCIISGRVKLLD